MVEQVDSGADPSKVVGSGIALDGIVYVRPFPTEFGEYPYPRQMRHGVWSCTKSLIGLVMAARLAQKYGDHVLDLLVKDYVDVTPADHDGWEGVTLRHVLSMCSGIGVGSEDVSEGNTVFPFPSTTFPVSLIC